VISETCPSHHDIRCRYDVVIVGARCAGATVATFLSRAGASVLLLSQRTGPHLPRNGKRATSLNPGFDLVEPSGLAEADQLSGIGIRQDI
jgi:glycine/D-amino acid oxidase-like deaminating enzyme